MNQIKEIYFEEYVFFVNDKTFIGVSGYGIDRKKATERINRLADNYFLKKDELLSALDAAEPISLDRYQVLEEGKAVGVTVFDTHRAYLQRAQVDPRAVDLIVDGRRIATYDLYASFGDVYMIYLAYDREGDALLVLHSDFDHYGVECATTLQAFRLEGESIRRVTKRSDWLRGRRDLPYNPYTFGIRE